MKILFKNAKILIKQNNKYEYLDSYYLGVDNNIINYIGKEMPSFDYDEVKDIHGNLLMPGLINAHSHSPMTLLRGVGAGLKLNEWLNNAIFPIEAKLTPDDIVIGCNLAMCEMISSGTTTYSEMYDFPYAEALAVAKGGMRSNICRTGLDFGGCNPPERYQESVDVASILSGKNLFNCEISRELKCDSLPNVIVDAIKDGRIKGDLSLHSEYLTTEEYVKKIVSFNKQNKFSKQVHVSETKKEHDECIARHGKTPTQYLYDLGYLNDGNAYFAHCVHVTDEDLKIMAKTGTTLVYNPVSNLKLGSGIAPIVKALQYGVKVAIGTDGCASNNNLDMFEEMHIGALIQSGIHNDPTCISSSDIIDMATINGALALNRNDIGKLEVGYKADIIEIDMSAPNLNPINDIADLIVYSMHGSNVKMTMVDGKILYEDGKFFTIDYEKIVKEVDNFIKTFTNR